LTHWSIDHLYNYGPGRRDDALRVSLQITELTPPRPHRSDSP